MDFRSTDAGTKLCTLTNHPNAYGGDGYLFFKTSNTNQETDGIYKGALYTGARDGQVFTNTTVYVAKVEILGTAGTGAGQWQLTGNDTGEAPMDDPSLGIGVGIANVDPGSFWGYPDSSATVTAHLRVTFNSLASTRSKIRLGVRTDRGGGQKPAIISLGGRCVPQVGQNDYKKPDWYFFDVMQPVNGGSLTLDLGNGTSRSAIQGLAFDSITVAARGTSVMFR